MDMIIAHAESHNTKNMPTEFWARSREVFLILPFRTVVIYSPALPLPSHSASSPYSLPVRFVWRWSRTPWPPGGGAYSPTACAVSWSAFPAGRCPQAAPWDFCVPRSSPRSAPSAFPRTPRGCGRRRCGNVASRPAIWENSVPQTGGHWVRWRSRCPVSFSSPHRAGSPRCLSAPAPLLPCGSILPDTPVDVGGGMSCISSVMWV